MTDLKIQEIASMSIDSYKVNKRLIRVNSARRHVVKINDIEASRNEYMPQTVIKSGELIQTPVRSIAIFSNEYIPEHFPNNDYVKYILNINGSDFEIIPINVQRDGKKIVRTTETSGSAASVHYINEEIKSAFLSIIIKTPNKNETPFVSNIKVLYGGD